MSVVVWITLHLTPAASQTAENKSAVEEMRSEFYMIPNDDDPRRGFILLARNANLRSENFEFCNGERSKLDLSTLVKSDSDCNGIPTGTLVYSAEQLRGAEIFANDLALIGEIDEVLTSADNSPQSLIVGVGGYLGIGEALIEIPFDLDNSDIQTSEDGNVAIVIRNMTIEDIRLPM
jgi:hypothetical protein